MEETKSRKNRKRKPFTDLSNITPAAIKPKTKYAPRKSILNNDADLNSSSDFTETGYPINDNVNNGNKSKKDKVTGPSDTTNPSSTRPLPNKTPSVSGDGDSVFSELSTVYKRRHTAEKRKNKGKEVMEPLSCSLETRIPSLREKTDVDGEIGLSKSCPLPCRKKQRREVNASKHELPQDFIDKQRAYFAEIDAFELEEEVASADESE